MGSEQVKAITKSSYARQSKVSFKHRTIGTLRTLCGRALRLLGKLKRPSSDKTDTPSAETRQGSKIKRKSLHELTENIEEVWAYYGPEIPRVRVKRVSSVYSCRNLDGDFRYIPAKAARKQVKAVPHLQAVLWGAAYPKRFYNIEKLELRAKWPYTLLEFPLLRNPPYNCWRWGRPGVVRFVYNDDDRDKFDVIYHDPTKLVSIGSVYPPFSKATYRRTDCQYQAREWGWATRNWR